MIRFNYAKKALAALTAAALFGSLLAFSAAAPATAAPAASSGAMTKAVAAPAAEPTIEPAAEPNVEPTSAPTVEPTSAPTVEPTSAPTVEPTSAPNVEPTAEPTVEPAEPSISVSAAEASTQGGVTGKVTGQTGATWILIVPENSANSIGSTGTDESGNFSISAADFLIHGPGRYTLTFNGKNANLNEFWDNAPDLASATFFSVPATTPLNMNVEMTTGSTISGIITDAAGAAIPGATVAPYRKNAGGSIEHLTIDATTNASGAYSFTGLTPGSYSLKITAPFYADKWWFGDATTKETANYFDVPFGTKHTKSIALTAYSKITGTVTDAAGKAISGAVVDVFSKTTGSTIPRSSGSAVTTATGTFEISGLVVGSYTVRTSKVGYVTEWWDNAASFDQAVYFTTSRLAATQRAISLATGAKISGTLTSAAGAVAGATVIAHLEGTQNAPGIRSATTATNGSYQLDSLPAGSYTLEFRAAGYQTQWLHNTTSEAKAFYFPVAAAETVTRIDAYLKAGASVTGMVRNQALQNIEGIRVSAYLKSSGSAEPTRVDSTYTQAEGVYSLGLDAGTYTLKFENLSTNMTQWWKNSPTVGAATYFDLTVGSSLVTMDARFADPATIAGTVKDSAGAALSGVTVTASSKTSGLGGTTTTDASGAYSFTGLSAASYTLQFSATGYLTKWWGDAASAVGATYFDLTAGQSITNNATLAKPVTIKGTVKDAAGVLSGVTVTATSTTAGVAGGTTTTTASGTYSIANLAAGNYTLAFSKTGYISTWWGGAASAAGATYFDLVEGDSSVNNVTLVKPSAITGAVKTTAAAALSGVTVTASSTTTGVKGGTTTTDASGAYSFTGLVAGNYTLTFSKTGYFTPAASSFALSAGESKTSNAILVKAATITGTVTDSAAAGLAGVTVTASTTTTGATGGVATTDASGAYSFTGLVAGSYTLKFSKSGYFTPAAPEFALAEGASKTNNVTLVTQATITGTVTDSTGALAGVTVTASSTTTGATGGTATTDMSGAYSFTGLAAGNYALKFSKTGYVSTTASELALVAGESKTSDVTLVKAATIKGTVKTAAGAGLVGVTVTASTTTTGAKGGTATTDASGKYSIEGLVAGSYTLEFSKTGYSSTSASDIDLAAGESTTTNASLIKQATITGTVKTTAGSVLTGVTVTASSATTGATGGSTTTDASGAYAFIGLVAGNYTLTFSKSGYFTPAASEFALAEGESKTTDVTLVKRSTITGTVKNAAGAVVSGVTVIASSTTAGAKGGTAKTDASGKYSFTGLVAGSYTLKFAKTGYVAQWWSKSATAAKAKYFTVAEGKTVTANAALARPTVKAATPKVTGTVAIGKTLKVSTGTWTSGTTFKYQWFAGSKAIKGATKSTFKITSAQKGATISVTVTGSKANYVSVPKTSAKTAKVVR